MGRIRPLWRHYYTGADAVIFVVDANDRDRIEVARDELHKLMGAEELRDATLLTFANKVDLPNSMSAAEIKEKMNLHAFRHREWYVQSACAVTGEGLYEGLDWLGGALSQEVTTHANHWRIYVALVNIFVVIPPP